MRLKKFKQFILILIEMKKILALLKQIDKRQRLAIAVATIVFFNLSITLLPLRQALFLLPVDILVIYLATFLALLEDINHIEWFVLFVLPIYLLVSILLFYYLLPTGWLTRLPFLVVLSVAGYASLLCVNIFNVGVEKSLPLYRAAFSVSNFLTLLAFFLLFTVLFSFRLHFLLNGFLSLLISWPLLFHNLWAANPKEVLEERIYKFATINGVLLSFAVLVLSFLPIKTNIYALYSVAVVYLLSGLTQEVINETAFKERVREYLIVFAALSVMVFLTISWA